MSLARRVMVAGLALAGGAAEAAAQQDGDSTLAAACAGGEAIADGLLLVEFRADVPPERRAAVAAEAGGTLVPAPDGGPAGYVAIPGGSRAASDAAADRLIRVDGVQAVGGVNCPPAPPATSPDSVRADSAARPDSSARPAAPGDTGASRLAPIDSIGPADSVAPADAVAPQGSGAPTDLPAAPAETP